MSKELTQTQAIDNVADGLQHIAEQLENNRLDRSDFNGYSIADSLGIIADAMFKIAEAMENKGEGA